MRLINSDEQVQDKLNINLHRIKIENKLINIIKYKSLAMVAQLVMANQTSL